jgi:hypothetical protein
MIALELIETGKTKFPFPVNSSYFRMPPLAPIVVHAGTPAAMPST